VALIGGLFLFGWLFSALFRFHDPTLRTLLVINATLLATGYLAIRAYYAGRNMHFAISQHRWRYVEAGLGIVLASVTLLAAVWLLTGFIGRLPFAGFSNSVNDAAITQQLDRRLPPIPIVFQYFRGLTDPNASPALAVQSPLTNEAADYDKQSFAEASAKAANSAVRVTSFGCGGTVSGSGFFAAPYAIITNAHVVAGMKRPIIKYNGRSYATKAVYFSSNLDLAVLRVDDVRGQPLEFAATSDITNATVAIIGYGSGDKAAIPGIIRSTFQAASSNIYGLGTISREVYEIQSIVAQGDSGSPVVLPNGTVAGILFAKSEVVGNYAYAFTSTSVRDNLARGLVATRQISTGACLMD
jgi:S1-C subfamily serine protease